MSDSHSDAQPISHPVLVASLPDDGLTVKLAPTQAQMTALAKDFGIPAIRGLKAQVKLTPERKGQVRVAGHLDAIVTQTCVVTLEDFEAPVSEEIDMRFAPEDQIPEIKPGAEIDVTELDLPDPLVNGIIDVGAVVAEFLALGLDPYPRKPDAAFDGPQESAAEETSPFAALSRLRPKEEDGSK